MLLLLVACRTAAPEPPLAFVEEPADRPAERLPLVVAVHGYGDRPESLLAMVRRCRLRARVVAPRGPFAQGQGWSWFRIDTGEPKAAFDPALATAAADRLAALVEHLVARRPVEGEVVLTGFSQGGILSFLVAARHPDRIGAAVPIAGMLPEALRPTGPPPAGAPPVRAFHGDADRLIPAAEARATVDAFTARGWDATLTTFDGVGHTVARPVHEAVCAALAAATGADRR